MSDAPRLSSLLDVDELLRTVDAAQAQIDDLSRQLERAGRLATLGTLAATLAHEFNNLLAPGIGYASLALASLDGDSPDLALVRKALTKARAGGEKAGRLGGAILDLARAPAAAPAVCDLNAVVDQALLALGRELPKDGIRLVRNVPPGLRVGVDALGLEHVLLNLLLNARAAMLAPGGRRGTLTLHATAADDDAVRLDVADTGCGISPERLGGVFEPFESGRAGGSGLGLHLCRRIVERHGGRVAVRSVVGRGSIFSLHLPAA